MTGSTTDPTIGDLYRGADSAMGARLLDSMPQAVGLSLLITLVAAGIDLSTSTINLSIVYSIPMALCARTARPGMIWQVAAGLMFLCFAGYFFGPWPADEKTWEGMFFHHRMLNRAIGAMAVLTIASMSHFGIALRRRLETRRVSESGHEIGQEVFFEVISSVEQFQAGMMSVMTVTLVAMLDLLSPTQYNPTALYMVPVLVSVQTRSRRYLWIIVCVVTLLIYVGLVMGPPPHIAAELLAKIKRNREIAVIMIVILGMFVHVWIGIDYPRRQRSRSRLGAAGGIHLEQKKA